jgi:hypothetical protein
MVDSRFEAALLDARYVDRVVQTTNKSEEEIAKEKPFSGVPLSGKGSIAVKGTKFLPSFNVHGSVHRKKISIYIE